MSAGHTVRRSLRAGRVRIALGVTGAAAALAIGGSFTAHADTSAPAPKPVPVQGTPVDVCPEPEPVDAVPDGSDNTPEKNQWYYEFDGGAPVDAVPGDGGVCAEPDPSSGDPVDAVPGGYDNTPDHNARDLRFAPAKR